VVAVRRRTLPRKLRRAACTARRLMLLSHRLGGGRGRLLSQRGWLALPPSPWWWVGVRRAHTAAGVDTTAAAAVVGDPRRSDERRHPCRSVPTHRRAPSVGGVAVRPIFRLSHPPVPTGGMMRP
jgi:hypothetical protein